MENLQFIDKLKIKIAGICISVENKDKQLIGLSPERKRLLAFRSKAKADYVLEVKAISRKKQFPDLLIKKPEFMTNSNWSYFQRKDNKMLWLDTPAIKHGWERMLITDRDFTQGKLYLLNSQVRENKIFDPLSYPIDQFLMFNLLAKQRGIMLHCCGMDFKGQGILFVGSSGSGKTTLADIWAAHTDCRILNDDRVILREASDKIMIFGTPWHGTGHYTDNHKLLLRKIFFLKHSKRNYSQKLSRGQTALRLIPALFAAFWDKPAMDYSLKLCAEIAEKIPAYELGVVPNKNIIKFINNTL